MSKFKYTYQHLNIHAPTGILLPTLDSKYQSLNTHTNTPVYKPHPTYTYQHLKEKCVNHEFTNTNTHLTNNHITITKGNSASLMQVPSHEKIYDNEKYVLHDGTHTHTQMPKMHAKAHRNATQAGRH